MLVKMSTGEIVLREYRESDLETIYRLDRDCFAVAFRFDRKAMQEFAEASNAICLVAETRSGDEIVGFVIVHLDLVAAGLQGYVVTLDVAEGYRREGIASRLMLEAESRVGAAGARRMELHVFTGNEGAIHFYERMGYSRAAVHRRFYRANGLDAFLYRKELAVL
jgi:[ribosomal protein S18]-alanine N-acetyltransferase